MADRGTPRRFAPLKNGPAAGDDPRPRLRGVVFDMDGTLSIPQTYMFGEMRELLGIPKSIDIMAHVNSLAGEEHERALAGIRSIETRAMRAQQPQPGLAELMEYLDARAVPKAILTRNCLEPVDHLRDRFLRSVDFDPIIARDSGHTRSDGSALRPKPSPDGIMAVAEAWNRREDSIGGDAAPGESNEQSPAAAVAATDSWNPAPFEQVQALARSLLMVGDGGDDMEAGRRAGAATVLLVNDVNRRFADSVHTDLVIERLDELIDILDGGFEGRAIGPAL